MGPPFTNLFASCCTSPSFVFGARFATPHMALGPMCHLMCWLLSCGLCCFAVLADRWQVILGEFPGRCTHCPRSAHAVQQLGPTLMSCPWSTYCKERASIARVTGPTCDRRHRQLGYWRSLQGYEV